jgi:hypothetical protein
VPIPGVTASSMDEQDPDSPAREHGIDRPGPHGAGSAPLDGFDLGRDDTGGAPDAPVRPAASPSGCLRDYQVLTIEQESRTR